MAAMPITIPVHVRTVSFSLKKIPEQTAESIIVSPFISGKKIIPGIFATSIRFSLLANTTLNDCNIAGTKNSLLYVTGCFSFFSDKASLNITVDISSAGGVGILQKEFGNIYPQDLLNTFLLLAFFFMLIARTAYLMLL